MSSWVVAGLLVAGGPPLAGFTAEVQVCLDGRVRYGRLIVEAGGAIYLEHLDARAARWCRGLLQPASSAAQGAGWDTRCQAPDGVWQRWTQVGSFEALAEADWLRLTRHRSLGRP